MISETLEIGRTNTLEIVKAVDFGLYLADSNDTRVLLPKHEAPAEISFGELLEVFVYLDSEDRPIATLKLPKAELDDYAFLICTQVNKIGAFLDWGLPKELFAPFAEQRIPMREGNKYMVVVYQDNSGRLAASSKLEQFFHETDEDKTFTPEQAVRIDIAAKTDMGYKVIVDGSHIGLLHQSVIHAPIQLGQTRNAHIKNIRDDGKLNLTLKLNNQTERDALDAAILDYLDAHDGICLLTDKSSPEDIYKVFKVSKANYKKALGRLYKSKEIELSKTEIKRL